MSKRRHEPADRQEQGSGAASALESGVLTKGMMDELAPERQPPWEVVLAYLQQGEHRLWVETHAARSAPFADVLRALQNDHEERVDQRAERARARGRGVVVRLKR